VAVTRLAARLEDSTRRGRTALRREARVCGDAVVTLLQRGAVTRDKQEDEDLRDSSEKPPPMRGKDPMKGVGGVGRRSAAALSPDDRQEPRGLDPPVLEEKEIGPPWSVSRYHVMGSLAYRLFHGLPPHGALIADRTVVGIASGLPWWPSIREARHDADLCDRIPPLSSETVRWGLPPPRLRDGQRQRIA
jgi:hypothetical protein